MHHGGDEMTVHHATSCQHSGDGMMVLHAPWWRGGIELLQPGWDRDASNISVGRPPHGLTALFLIPTTQNTDVGEIHRWEKIQVWEKIPPREKMHIREFKNVKYRNGGEKHMGGNI